ncbi:MAG: hypothetical protein HQL79_07800 [Magnetococcales bacterium]|nr:hypothetical protein [Magnetococcales bacterium]
MQHIAVQHIAMQHKAQGKNGLFQVLPSKGIVATTGKEWVGNGIQLITTMHY